MRKICVVTGSRAEYGILRGLMKAIKEDPELTLQVIATNQHLSKLQGETYKEIERDGFTIDYKVYMADDEAPDNANTTATSISRGVSGFADAFDALKPDLLLILGDRYEMLAVASTALIYNFPALEKEMATHSSVLAWRTPGTAEPGGLPSMRSNRVGHA